MHTRVILTNKRRTHAQSNCTNTKLKSDLGASYAIRPGNGVGLFYSPDPHRGLCFEINISDKQQYGLIDRVLYNL